MLCENNRHFDTNSTMTDKRLVTTGSDYEARGLVPQAFLEGILEFCFVFAQKKNILQTKTQHKKEKMSDRYPVCDPLVSICSPPEKQLKYVTKQREGGNEVVFWLAIKNAALIQWHKLKQETPGIAYIDMLNGIIPG